VVAALASRRHGARMCKMSTDVVTVVSGETCRVNGARRMLIRFGLFWSVLDDILIPFFQPLGHIHQLPVPLFLRRPPEAACAAEPYTVIHSEVRHRIDKRQTK